MYVTTTSMRSDGTCWVTTQEVTGLRDHIVALIAEDACRHNAGNPEAFCLLDPPTWIRYLGIPNCVSVGSVMNRVANWAIGAQDKLPVVDERQVDFEVLIETFGWSRTSLLGD